LNHGKGGGALTGQPIVSQLEQSLRSLVQYSGGSGTIQNLSDIGLSFDSTGNLTFDSTKFESAQASDPGGVTAFLGVTSTSGTGTGFLGTMNSALTALEDPINGLFKTTNDNYQTQINKDSDQVNTIEARITTMQAALVQQMSLADAALSALESQLTLVTGLFKATADAINNS
jgi:flagellar hook-associated protein 2